MGDSYVPPPAAGSFRNGFYGPGRDGPAKYTESRTRAITAALVKPRGKTALFHKAGGREVPADWTNGAFQTQVAWSVTDPTARVDDEATQTPDSIPVRSVLWGFKNATRWYEAQSQIKVRGIFPTAVNPLNPRVGPIYTGDVNVTVHDTFYPGDIGYASFPYCEDPDDWLKFVKGEDIKTTASIAELFPLLRFATRTDSFIPPQVPTLHVVTERTFRKRGGLCDMDRVFEFCEQANEASEFADEQWDENAEQTETVAGFMGNTAPREPHKDLALALYGFAKILQPGMDLAAFAGMCRGARERATVDRAWDGAPRMTLAKLRRNLHKVGDRARKALVEAGRNARIGVALTPAMPGGTVLFQAECLPSAMRRDA